MAKLKSRKLWVAIAGIASGIGLYVSGDVQQGMTLILTSVVGYLGAEGLVDIAKTFNTISYIEEIASDVKDGVSSKEEE